MLNISCVTPQIFENRFPLPAHLYNTVEFSELNRFKCDDGDVRYLLLGDSKVRGGIILGRHGNTLHSPFSAPFGGLLTNRNQHIEIVDEIWHKIVEYVRNEGLSLRVTLPPLFYDPAITTKTISALHRLGLKSVIDLNFHLEPQFAQFSSSFKNQLSQALASGASVRLIEPTGANIERVYRIIEANHHAKNRPVRMSLDNVMDTAAMANADFFLLTHDGCDIAGAMAYHVSQDIAQAIYWGDVPGHASLRPMNLLASCMIEHYKRHNVKILDFGPSTEDGEPNVGLCSFKEDFGCMATPKYTFTI
jgi:hypothetical protein